MPQGDAGGPITCPGCTRRAGAGDRFCGHCRTPLAPGIPSPRLSVDGVRLLDHDPLEERTDVGHETTRVIAAAVHRDPELAATLIDRFLVEPKRCIAWSRGLDNAAVLTDAVAAFRRHRIRDLVLGLLGLLVLIATPFVGLAWLAAAMFATACGVGRPDDVPAAAEERRRSSVVVALLASGGPLVAAAVLLVLQGVASLGDSRSEALADFMALGAGTLRAGLAATALIVVLLVLDAVGTVHLMVTAFSRARFVGDPTSDPISPWRTLGWRRFAPALGRVRAAEVLHQNCADVVVFDGDSPFCGSGAPARTRAFVLTLYRDDSGEETEPAGLDVRLHQAIRSAMDDLSASESLSPSHRLATLRRREQVLIPAEELVRHGADPELARFLPQGFAGPPAREFAVDEARTGISRPHEWARYYQYFSVEAWDREVVVSWYVTLATDRQYLYLQWTPCGLLPLPVELRDELDDIHQLWRGVRRRLVPRLLTFPATVPTRLRRACRRFRPQRVPEGAVAPGQFGATASVREIAEDHLSASTYAGHWFQRSDTRRYVILFDRVMIDAVRRCLEDQGLSVAEFNQVAQSIVNNFGSISNSIVAAGEGASASGVVGGPLDPGNAS